jgi:hypothetical protein
MILSVGGDTNPWTGLPHQAPYVAPVDRELLTEDVIRRGDLKLGCLPVPWIGDPSHADVVLLGLNPGWTAATEELEGGVYAEENRLGLTFESRVPMWNLDERLAGTPGHRWWSRRLRLVIERAGLPLGAVQDRLRRVVSISLANPSSPALSGAVADPQLPACGAGCRARRGDRGHAEQGALA